MQLSDQLSEAKSYIRSLCPLKPTVGLILGSGMGSFAESIEKQCVVEYESIPHFGTTSVAGHSGKLYLGTVAGVPIAALQGRLHYYEGYTMPQVVFPTRTLAMLGIKVLVVTNAAGGLRKKMKPGDFMVINDHINLFGDNPLKGKNLDDMGPRFPDMTDAYDKSLVRLALNCAKKVKLRATQGVYVGLTGPTYETPAEVKYLQKIGGDAVGMSTVPEVIAANHFGVRTVGVSCITNQAAGLSKTKLSHDEVTQTGKLIESQFKDFVTLLVQELGALHASR
ncbi:MAG: purine-nucleoside phosphorylase [Oligoflexia bacterium]|nr:purine-nucleoside phosphorylase [Oligoflexia bacterium]